MTTEMHVIVDKIVIDDSGAVSGAKRAETAYDKLSAAAGRTGDAVEGTSSALATLSRAAGTAVSELGGAATASVDLAAATVSMAHDVMTAERAWTALELAVAANRAGMLGLKREIAETVVETKLFGEEADRASRAWATLTKAAGAVGISLSVGGLLSQAQEYHRAQMLIQRTAGESADVVERSLYRISQTTGAAFTELASLTKGLDELPGGLRASLETVEAVSLAMAQMPGNAQGAKAALTQFTQAMQSGVLRGDEFNSMMEQAPALADALADGLDVTRGQLRSMAEDGELSAARVSGALRGVLPDLRQVNSEIERTLSQSALRVDNALTIFSGRVDMRAGGSAVLTETMDDVVARLESLEAQNAAVAVLERMATAGGLASDALFVLADNIDLVIGAWGLWNVAKATTGMYLFSGAARTAHTAMRALGDATTAGAPAMTKALTSLGVEAQTANKHVMRLQRTMNSGLLRRGAAFGLASSFAVNPFSILVMGLQAAAAGWLIYESRLTDAQAAAQAHQKAEEILRGTLAGTTDTLDGLIAKYESLNAERRTMERADLAKTMGQEMESLRKYGETLDGALSGVYRAGSVGNSGNSFLPTTDIDQNVTKIREIVDRVASGALDSEEALRQMRRAAEAATPAVREAFAGALNDVASTLKETDGPKAKIDRIQASIALLNGDMETARRLWPEVADSLRDIGGTAEGLADLTTGLESFIERAAQAGDAAPALREVAEAMRLIKGVDLTGQAVEAFASGLLTQGQFDATYGAIQKFIDQGDKAFQGAQKPDKISSTLASVRFARAQLDRDPVEQAVASALRQAGTTEGTEGGAQIASIVRETEKLIEKREELKRLEEERRRNKAAAHDATRNLERENKLLDLRIRGEGELADRLQFQWEMQDRLGGQYDANAEKLLREYEQRRLLTEELDRQRGLTQELHGAADRAFDRIGSAITEAFVRGEGAAIRFKSVTHGVLSELAQETIKLAALNPLKQMLLGDGGSGSTGWLLGGIEFLAGAYFNSPQIGAASGGTRLSVGSNLPYGGARAEGGPVYPGHAYLVGERGPEPFVPSMPGTIIPNEMFSGGRGQVVNHTEIHVTVEGGSRGSAEDDQALAVQIGQVIDRQVEARINAWARDQMRSGGMFNRG